MCFSARFIGGFTGKGGKKRLLWQLCHFLSVFHEK
jgi:hypothetical protein